MQTNSLRWRTAAMPLLAGALSVVSLSSIRAQERIPIAPAPARPAAPVPGPRLAPPRAYEPTTVPGLEVESTVPFEVTADPEPGRDGDLWATRPVPAHLKGNPYRISYVGGDYTPPPHERVDPLLLRRMALAGAEGRTYGFIMFEGRITERALARVESTGATLNDFHTFNSYTAVIPYEAVPRLRALDCVRWIGYARPEQKIEPDLRAAMRDAAVAATPATRRWAFVNVYESDLGPRSQRLPIRPAEGGTPEPRHSDRSVELTPHVTRSNGPIQELLEAEGCRVLSYHDPLRAFLVEVDLAQVEAIVAQDVVHYMELFWQPIPDHDRSTRQIGVDLVRNTSAGNGSDTVVGLFDSGAYMGPGRHMDLDKWSVAWNFGGSASAHDDSDGHGTHVLGTICGTGTGHNRYKGCAPAVGSASNRRIFLGRIFDAADFPNNMLAAFDTFRNPWGDTPAPSVINNSWGYGDAAVNGHPGTDNISRAVDSAVYNGDQTYVFSASNTGGTYTNPVFNSIRRPNVAKSAFTVASANDHKGADAQNVAYEAGQITGSSGKGNTSDGRFKPNISAPGDSVRSCKTLTRSDYVDKSGTSMAAPHVTGVIAGLHTHLPNFATHPALTKAMLAATANPYLDTRATGTVSQAGIARQGLGQVDAYKVHYQQDVPNGYKSGYARGDVLSNELGSYFDIFVPGDADRTMFVLNFDEPSASAGATRACLGDLDLYIDVEPFSSEIDEGEFASRARWDTWDWYSNLATIGELRGKNVRIKVHKRVGHGGRAPMKWGVGFIIYRGDTSPEGRLSITAPDAVQPNTDFVLSASATVPSEHQTNVLMWLSYVSGYTVQEMRYVTPDGLLRVYTPSTLFAPTDSLFDWTLGNVPYFLPLGERTIEWTLRKAGEGRTDVCVEMRADDRIPVSTLRCLSVCVDGTAPDAPGSLHSTTHTPGRWSNVPDITLTWTPGADSGCAGLERQFYGFDLGTTCPPLTNVLSSTSTSVTFENVAESTATTGYVFGVRGRDAAGNAGPIACGGPFKIDRTRPTITSVEIEGGAQVTSSPDVQVVVAAFDALSGVDEIQFSVDGGAWSPWQPYSRGPIRVTLGAGFGSRRVEARVRDLAGNVSLTGFDTITMATSVHVVSNLQNVSITASVPDLLGNTGAPTPFTLYYLPQVVVLTAPANVGALQFKQWIVDGAPQPIHQRGVPVRLTAAHQAQAVYAPFTAGRVEHLGQGCSGSNGQPLTLQVIGTPEIEHTLTYRLTNHVAPTAAWLVIGFSDTIWAGLPLPLDLAFLGAPSCQVYTDHVVVLPTAAGSAQHEVRLPLPDGPWAIGLVQFAQYVAQDLSANNLGLTLSNYARITVGGFR